MVKNFFRFSSLNSAFVSPSLKQGAQKCDAVRVSPGVANSASKTECQILLVYEIRQFL